jgi:hypothetical protein
MGVRVGREGSGVVYVSLFLTSAEEQVGLWVYSLRRSSKKPSPAREITKRAARTATPAMKPALLGFGALALEPAEGKAALGLDGVVDTREREPVETLATLVSIAVAGT